MRFSIVCCCLLLQAVGSHAQVQEHFDSPIIAWKGTDTAWRVKEGLLQSHLKEVNSSYYLSTPSVLAHNCSWEWWMRLDFNTSSLNYSDVYLMADSANLLATTVKGYFVRIGNTKDEICLYRKTAVTPVMIVDGRDGITDHSSNVLKIKVTLDEYYEWTLWVDDTGTGNYYIKEGSVKDSSFRNARFMGIAVKQSTASFFEKHFFDDVVVAAIVKDTTAPSFQSLNLVSDRELDICFSELLDSSSTGFSVTGLQGNITADVNGSCVRLTSDTPFPNGDSCHIQIKGISDPAGNIVTPFSTAFLYYKASAHDVVINEVLYDGLEFVELYNTGIYAIDLSELYFSRMASDKPVALSSTKQLLLPRNYAAFTTDPAALCKQYNCRQPENIYKMNLPALINKEGSIILSDASGEILDKLNYSDDMQFALADNTKGVSLERLDAGMPSDDPHNWHSAAATAGYATPGSVNSQQLTSGVFKGELTVTPAVFSPDNDGTDDVAVIHYELPEPGYVANITIYDAGGRPVRYLERNFLLGTKGQMIWDGLGEANKMLPTGVYIVFTEIFSLKGNIKRWKLPLVLAKRLN